MLSGFSVVSTLAVVPLAILISSTPLSLVVALGTETSFSDPKQPPADHVDAVPQLVAAASRQMAGRIDNLLTIGRDAGFQLHHETLRRAVVPGTATHMNVARALTRLEKGLNVSSEIIVKWTGSHILANFNAGGQYKKNNDEVRRLRLTLDSFIEKSRKKRAPLQAKIEELEKIERSLAADLRQQVLQKAPSTRQRPNLTTAITHRQEPAHPMKQVSVSTRSPQKAAHRQEPAHPMKQVSVSTRSPQKAAPGPGPSPKLHSSKKQEPVPSITQKQSLRKQANQVPVLATPSQPLKMAGSTSAFHSTSSHAGIAAPQKYFGSDLQKLASEYLSESPQSDRAPLHHKGNLRKGKRVVDADHHEQVVQFRAFNVSDKLRDFLVVHPSANSSQAGSQKSGSDVHSLTKDALEYLSDKDGGSVTHSRAKPRRRIKSKSAHKLELLRQSTKSGQVKAKQQRAQTSTNLHLTAKVKANAKSVNALKAMLLKTSKGLQHTVNRGSTSKKSYKKMSALLKVATRLGHVSRKVSKRGIISPSQKPHKSMSTLLRVATTLGHASRTPNSTAAKTSSGHRKENLLRDRGSGSSSKLTPHQSHGLPSEPRSRTNATRKNSTEYHQGFPPNSMAKQLESSRLASKARQLLSSKLKSFHESRNLQHSSGGRHVFKAGDTQVNTSAHQNSDNSTSKPVLHARSAAKRVNSSAHALEHSSMDHSIVKSSYASKPSLDSNTSDLIKSLDALRFASNYDRPIPKAASAAKPSLDSDLANVSDVLDSSDIDRILHIEHASMDVTNTVADLTSDIAAQNGADGTASSFEARHSSEESAKKLAAEKGAAQKVAAEKVAAEKAAAEKAAAEKVAAEKVAAQKAAAVKMAAEKAAAQKVAAEKVAADKAAAEKAAAQKVNAEMAAAEEAAVAKAAADKAAAQEVAAEMAAAEEAAVAKAAADKAAALKVVAEKAAAEEASAVKAAAEKAAAQKAAAEKATAEKAAAQKMAAEKAAAVKAAAEKAAAQKAAAEKATAAKAAAQKMAAEKAAAVKTAAEKAAAQKVAAEKATAEKAAAQKMAAEKAPAEKADHITSNTSLRRSHHSTPDSYNASGSRAQGVAKLRGSRVTEHNVSDNVIHTLAITKAFAAQYKLVPKTSSSQARSGGTVAGPTDKVSSVMKSPVSKFIKSDVKSASVIKRPVSKVIESDMKRRPQALPHHEHDKNPLKVSSFLRDWLAGNIANSSADDRAVQNNSKAPLATPQTTVNMSRTLHDFLLGTSAVPEVAKPDEGSFAALGVEYLTD